jgi:glycosyltransferase involved in cell wall biosynthesis
MRIAQVAPLWISVPPHTYGGTELVVSWLCDELVKRGHQVTLFSVGSSKTLAKLVPIWPKGIWGANLSTPHAVFSLLYTELLKRQEEFDIIHDHCEWYSVPFSKFLKPPIVTTLHHPLTEETIILYKKFPNIHYVAISNNQKKSGPGINFVKTVYHGLPVEKYPFNPQPKDYLLWLSKIIPQKGLAKAIEIAKMAGQRLIIAGYIPPGEGDYFDYRIKPLIDGKQIQFVGKADFIKKIELFKNAKAFLFPIRRPEPFGLVVIEAMACGTPVIAYKEGSMAELIKDGKTGFLVNSKEEAVSAIKKIDQIKRIDCYRHVARKFNLKKMVNKYEALYNTILKNSRKNNAKKTTA